MGPVVRPRRLFVSGGSRLSSNAALLWRELGRLLAKEDGLVMITGGLLRMKGSRLKAADLAIVEGFEEGLARRKIDPSGRLETYLPDPDLDFSEGLERFAKGSVRVLSNRTSQARRFHMVFASDVVISIEGDKGTRSVLDVALALERPIFPVPCGGGESARVWRRQRSNVSQTFHLTAEESAELSQSRLRGLDVRSMNRLAKKLHAWLMGGFTPNCFVIMPFQKAFDRVYELAIAPALVGCGLHPVRTDKLIVAGNLVTAIREGLKNCYFVVADITGDRPNVMYELGMAHANLKPVILLRQTSSASQSTGLPFDLLTESTLFYGRDLGHLRKQLESAISVLTGRTPAKP